MVHAIAVFASLGRRRRCTALAIVLIALAGCSDQSKPLTVSPLTPADKVARTRAWLSDLATGTQPMRVSAGTAEESLPPREKYRLENLERALETLRRATPADFDRPQPVEATVEPSGTWIVVQFSYLANSPQAPRIYLADAQGNTLAEADLALTSTKEDEEALGILRVGGIVIDVNASYHGVLPVVALEPRHLAEEIQVGIFEPDGSRGLSVRAFVDPAIRRRAAGARQ